MDDPLTIIGNTNQDSSTLGVPVRVDGGAFYINLSTTTSIYVQDTGSVNAAISGYDWNSSGRTPAYYPLSSAPVYGETGSLKYEIKDGKVIIFGCDRDTEGELEIPDIIDGYNVTEIGIFAFSDCTEITKITIPAYVDTISLYAFNQASNLTDIVVNDLNGNYSSKDGILYNKDKTELILCPEGKTGLVKDIPDSVTSIGQYAFQYSNITEIILPSGLKSIGTQTIVSCSALQKIYIPATVKAISRVAFMECNSLAEISFGHTAIDSLNIEEMAFLPFNGSLKIIVPSISEINSAISGYNWEHYNGTLTYITAGSAELIDITSQPVSCTVYAGNSATLSVEADYSGEGELNYLWKYYDYTTQQWKDANELGTATSAIFKIDNVDSSFNRYNFKCVVSVDNVQIVETKTVKITVKTQMNPISIYTNEEKEYTWVYDGLEHCGNVTVSPAYEGTTVTYSTNGIDYSDTIPTIKDVGSITVIVKATNSQYGLESTASYTMNVTPKAVTVSAVDMQKVVGEKDPEFLADVDGLVEGDTIEYTLERNSGEDIGSYTITPTGEKIQGNYKITYKSGTFVIIGSNVQYSGKCGDHVVWTLDCDGLLTIFGTGDMYDFNGVYVENSEPPVNIAQCKQHKGDIKRISILNGVTSIGDDAFSSCSSLISIEIPNSITSIGDNAFYDCSILLSIKIPDNVTTIGDSAFSGCSGLTTIDIGDGVTTIGDSTFSRCSGLTSISIGDGVTSIGDFAFQSCSSLLSVEIPDNVTTIGDSAFYGCSGLTTIDMGDGVTTIGDGAFFACKSLTNVEIGDGVTSIGDFAFQSCSSLLSVEIPDNVTTIGDSAFIGCSGLTTIDIGDGVTTIGDSAFIDCSGLTTIDIGDGVTTIGDCAFYGCSSLVSIKIPNSVTSIGCSTFENCTSLTKLDIQDSITSIGDRAFRECNCLTNVEMGNGVTSIGEDAFYNCSRLTGISLPNSITCIGDGAYAGCSDLTSIVIPYGITSIGASLFCACSSIVSITIPYSVTSIGNYAFDGCSNLTDINYTGTAEEWNEINIGYGNYQLTLATKYYNCVCSYKTQNNNNSGDLSSVTLNSLSFTVFENSVEQHINDVYDFSEGAEVYVAGYLVGTTDSDGNITIDCKRQI